MASWLAAALGPALAPGRAWSADEITPLALGGPFAVDRLSGLPLRGFDPVSYFALPLPLPGSAELELVWNGATWRFATKSNREAFRRDPDVYAPRIGGFDPVAAAQGALVDAEPSIYAIRESRLYLFRTENARRRLMGEAGLAEAAEARWPELRRQVTGL